MNAYNYRIIPKEEPESGFSVIVPSLSGCITYGKTVSEAKENAKEAIELYIESLKEENLPIPTDDNLLEYNLQISHA